MLPVLWLCGPPGVGKSTVAWSLFRERAGAGYVDTDQLGMCYPATADDPGRLELQARILGRVAAAFAAAGASSLIVSGCVDARRGIHTSYLAGVSLTALRLRCDRVELRRRLTERARPSDHWAAALASADELDHSGLPYPHIDTTSLPPAEILAIVRDRWRPSASPWPMPAPAALPGPAPGTAPGSASGSGTAPGTTPGSASGSSSAPGSASGTAPGSASGTAPGSASGEIVVLCGTTAVGKSTAGWELARLSQQAGHMTGFVDLQQIGFLDGGDHRLKAANLAGAWAEFHANGARRLVVNGHLDDDAQFRHYTEVLPAATITIHRLHAGPDALRSRFHQRGLGRGPLIAGDELRGQPADVLEAAYEAAVGRTGIGDRVDTDGHTPAETAQAIAHRIGWP